MSENSATPEIYAAGPEKSASKTGSHDTCGVAHRLTFRADPDLLEPKEKHRKKLSRNDIEKLRRDRLNAYFMELAKIVPLVMQSNKKIDKASILRLTVAYLRIYHDLVKGSKRSKLSCSWRPDLTMYENLGNLLLQSFGGFLLVISRKGVLIFATEAITMYLGHSLSDVLGSEVKNIIHPNDYGILMKQFEVTERDAMIKDTDDETDTAHVPVNGQRSFCVKMLNVLDPQSTSYEMMHLVGHLKRMPPVNGTGFADSSSVSGAHSAAPEPSVCLVAVAKLVSRQPPVQELSPNTNSIPNQWITRHELDGKITYSDQRGALLTGFLPGESIGFSPYSLLHPNDIASVVAVHNLFLTAGCVPQTVFRMFTKSRDIIYIQTNTHLVVDMWTSKPKFIISINTVLEEQDGLLALEEQRLRIYIAENSKACSRNRREESDVREEDYSVLNSHSSTRENLCCISENSLLMSVSSDRSDFVSPEIETEGSSVFVVVGESKHLIDMSDVAALDPKNSVHDSSISIAFDSYATEDDGGKCIPTVKPSFVGGDTTYLDQLTPGTRVRRSNSSMESEDSCTRITAELDEPESCSRSDRNGFAARVTRSEKSILTSEIVRRRFSNGDSNSLIELSEFIKMNGESSHPFQGSLLLRQLLTEKLGTSCNGKNGNALHGEVENAEPTLTAAAGSSAESMHNEGTTSSECPQIKSLLRTERISSAASRKEPSANRNGRTPILASPENFRWNNLWNNSDSLSGDVSPSTSSFSGSNSGSGATAEARRSSHDLEVASGSSFHADPRCTKTTSELDACSSITSALGIKFKPDAGKILPDTLTRVRRHCSRTHPNSGCYQNGTSQNGCSRPLQSSESKVQSHCGNGLSHSNGHRLSRVNGSDPVCSSVVDLVSAMSHDNKYRSLKQFLGETDAVATVDNYANNSDSTRSSRQRVSNLRYSGAAELSDRHRLSRSSAAASPVPNERHRNWDAVAGEGE